jgi:hypothetical protein
VYSTCIFCHTSLGTNESIEHFPIGRRLAFDAAQGRLWVVCRSCERWNLTPIEERWEAIEECERAFSDTKLRVSTDHIGLARMRDGTTLIRIGEPQRPEMAAWRYGDQFGRRRRKYLLVGGASVAALGGLIIAGPVMGLIGAASVNVFNVANFINEMRTIARVNVNGEPLRLNKYALNRVQLRPNVERGFEIEMPYAYPWSLKSRVMGGRFALGSRSVQGSVTLAGDDALRAARVLLPRINVGGGGRADLRDALSLLEEQPAADALFSRMAAVKERRHRSVMREGWIGFSEPQYRLGGLTPAKRLALEMALHEEDERRALEGELSELEERWREAEEIASISDQLFVPKDVDEKIGRLKKKPS